MKQKMVFLAVLIFALSATTLPALAARNNTDLYGDPASISAATREILIDPNTTHVNVKQGEIIKFVADDKTFAWSFDVGPTVRSFDLRDILPEEVLNQPVTVYIEPDPRRGK
jgi:hypothetical protein